MRRAGSRPDWRRFRRRQLCGRRAGPVRSRGASLIICQGLAVGGKDDRFAAGAVVLGTDVGKAAALWKELFNHAKGDAKAAGDLALGAVAFVVGS